MSLRQLGLSSTLVQGKHTEQQHEIWMCVFLGTLQTFPLVTQSGQNIIHNFAQMMKYQNINYVHATYHIHKGINRSGFAIPLRNILK